MTVTVLFFAHYQDVAGGREQRLALNEGATARDLASQLQRDHPGLGDLLGQGRVAVNAEFADGETILRDGDEVAWMPPMSGGTDGVSSRVFLTDGEIDVAAISRSVEADDCGAVVTFAGTVRDHAQGRRVLFLEYEAYAPLAEKQLSEIAAQAQERWQVRCAVTHRLGRVEIGACSVAVAVASAHRAEAFDACRWLMDTLKATVPIWKKEYFEDGVCWIEGPQSVPTMPPPAPPDAGAGGSGR